MSDKYYHILSVAKQLLEGTFFVWYRESAKSTISTSRLYIWRNGGTVNNKVTAPCSKGLLWVTHALPHTEMNKAWHQPEEVIMEKKMVMSDANN